MRASRGMGAIAPSKMPGKKVIHRKDNPNDVDLYADGGQAPGKMGQRARLAQTLKKMK